MSVRQEPCDFPGSSFVAAFLQMHRIAWACHHDETTGQRYLRAEQARWAVETSREDTITREMGLELLELVRNRMDSRP